MPEVIDVDPDDRDLTALTTSSESEFNIDRWHFAPTEFALTGSGQPPTFEEWEQIGKFVRVANTACQWWWGDWLNYGEMAFGEACAQAIEETNWEKETLRNYAWVAARVPKANRHADIRFYMYSSIAKLTEDEQAEWVSRILNEKMNHQDLKAALKGEVETVEKYYVEIACVDENEQATLVNRFNDEGLTATATTKTKSA